MAAYMHATVGLANSQALLLLHLYFRMSAATLVILSVDHVSHGLPSFLLKQVCLCNFIKACI